MGEVVEIFSLPLLIFVAQLSLQAAKISELNKHILIVCAVIALVTVSFA
jgi:hypothetical protein